MTWKALFSFLVRQQRRFLLVARLLPLCFHTDAFEGSGHLSGSSPGRPNFAYPAQLSIATVSFATHKQLVSVKAKKQGESASKGESMSM
jgi:hypothetical protein